MLKNALRPLIGFTIAMLAAVIAATLLIPREFMAGVGALYRFLTQDMGWFFLLVTFACACIALLCLFSRIGDIRLGGRNAVPEYSTFTWIAMNVCNALAAGILIFGAVEWMYYVQTPPLGLEPGSPAAYETALPQAMFHWGFSVWAVYLVPGLAIGYLYWNRRIGTVRISALGASVFGDKPFGRACAFVLDAVIVFGYLVTLMVTVGLGTPVMGEIAANLFGVSNGFGTRLAVIFVFCAFFSLTALQTIRRGMGRLSDVNVWLGLAFFAYVLLCGDTVFILDNTVSAVGASLREFLRFSLNADAVKPSGVVESWTVFYLAWYVAIGYMVAIWIARTSYGRTFREITMCNCVWSVLAGWLSFACLGNYGMGQELFHGLEVSKMIGEIGNEGATMMVLSTLPFPKLAGVVFLLLIFLNIATSAVGSGTSLSIYTARGLEAHAEPHPVLKAFWCILLLVLPVAVLFLERAIPGLSVLRTIQSLITVASIPMIPVFAVLFWAFARAVREDLASGALQGAVDERLAWRWPAAKTASEDGRKA